VVTVRDVGFTIEERFFLTAQELEYSEVGEEHESVIDRAIALLYTKLRTKDFEFTDEERELLEDAFVIVSDQ
jgi:hypothetical protein